MQEQDVRDALYDVIDPEVGINVVDLGLVRAIHLEEGLVQVVMIMTTPACPLGPYLQEQATAAITRRVPEATQVEVHVAWTPPWDASLISDEGRRQLGWDGA